MPCCDTRAATEEECGAPASNDATTKNSQQDPTTYKIATPLDIEASAGSGALVELEESSSYVSFTTQYLRQLGFSSPDNAHIVKIKGNSMHGGELVLGDTGVQEYKSEGIYIVRIDDLLAIKRLQKIGPCLKVMSDNPHYDNFYVDETTNFSIAARFVLGTIMKKPISKFPEWARWVAFSLLSIPIFLATSI